MATLKFSIKEELVLNGANRGSENVISITGVTQSFHRIVTCPLNEDTTVATFRDKVSTSATAPVDGALDLEDVKYIRVTNLDATNPVNLSLQIAGGEEGVANMSTTILLAAGRTFIMGAPHDGVATSDTNATIVTALNDLESILIDPLTNSIDVEVFIAS